MRPLLPLIRFPVNLSVTEACSVAVKIAKRITIWICGGAAFLAFLVWLVLSSDVFHTFRASLASDWLSDELGTELSIDGDACLTFDGGPQVVVTDRRLPAPDFPEVDLARLGLVYLRLFDGLRAGSDLYLSRMRAEGLEINLHRRLDGSTTWDEREGDQENRADDQTGD